MAGNGSKTTEGGCAVARKKAKKKKQKRWPKIVLFILLAALLLALAALVVYPRLSPNAAQLSKAPIQAGVPAAAFRNGVAVLQDNLLLYYSGAGVVQWHAPAEGFSGLSAAPNYIVAYSPSIARAFDGAGKQLYEFSPGESILSARSSGAGTLLLVSSNGVSTLIMVDNNGKELERIALDGNSVLNYRYDESSKSIWVMSLLRNVVVPQTQITIYKSRAVTGYINVYDQTATQVMQNGEDFFVVGTNQILCYNTAWKLQYSHLVYGWHMLDGALMGGKTTMLFGTRRDSALTAARIVVPNGSDISLRMEGQCLAAVLYKEKLCAVMPEYVQTYSISGKKQHTYALNTRIDSVRTLGSGLCLATAGGQTYILTLP